MKGLMIPALAVVCLVVTGCGNKSGDAAQAMNGLFSKSQTSTFQLKQLVHDRYSAARQVAEGQAWLTRFRVESDSTIAPMITDDPERSCTGSNPGTGSSSFDITCTNSSADDTFTCGSKTYTWHSGSTFRFYGSYASNVFTVNMSMSGRISGGGFDANTALACTFGFSFDLTKLALGSSETFSADCSNTNLSCTVGSETIGCEDLIQATNDRDNQCSS